MAIQKILTEPNKILRQVSLSVKNFGKEEQILMDDMLDTMYHANGIGLFCGLFGDWNCPYALVL